MITSLVEAGIILGYIIGGNVFGAKDFLSDASKTLGIRGRIMFPNVLVALLGGLNSVKTIA